MVDDAGGLPYEAGHIWINAATHVLAFLAD